MAPVLPAPAFSTAPLSCIWRRTGGWRTFVGKEAALVFSTGYQTNLGTVSALLGKNDVAILDKDAHACLVDGVQMSRGPMKRFKHNDVNDLERVLSRLPDDAGKLVIVDGVYSMGGDFAPLAADCGGLPAV